MNKYLTIAYDVKSDYIYLDSIHVDKEYRNQGIATEAMLELCELADRENKLILLTATNNKNKKFYKKFDFVTKKGYFEYPRANMIRLPK